MSEQQKLRNAINEAVDAIEQRVNAMIMQDVTPALAWRLAISFELEKNYYKGVAEMAKLAIAEMITTTDRRDMN